MKGRLHQVIKEFYETIGMQFTLPEGVTYTFTFKGIRISLETDDQKGVVLVTCQIGELPSGTYRRDVLHEALRHNGFPPPWYGKFGYSSKMDKLYLFHSFPIANLSRDRIIRDLPPFVETAKSWINSVAGHAIPVAAQIPEGQLPNLLDLLDIKL